MASSILISNYQSKAFWVLGFLCISMLMQMSNATDFAIGGSKGWTVDSSTTSYYNKWAEKNRFQIGDSIVFVYPAGQDSVLLVNQNDYNNCNTDNPQQKFTDGHTSYKFTQSGPHYFISGNRDNCNKNEKVVVIVLADRSNRSANSNQTNVDSPPPSAEASPSPAPSGEQSPPAPTGENNPTPAPTSDQTPPPPSGASATFISFMGCMGAFVASSLFLVF
ncbi:hypothetical protein UlMin_003504 [Ulmus minor]